MAQHKLPAPLVIMMLGFLSHTKTSLRYYYTTQYIYKQLLALHHKVDVSKFWGAHIDDTSYLSMTIIEEISVILGV